MFASHTLLRNRYAALLVGGLALLVALLVPGSATAAAEPVFQELEVPTAIDHKVLLRFALQPAGGPWKPHADGHTFHNAGYELTVAEKPREADVTALGIRLRRKTGEAFKVLRSEVSLSLKAGEIQKIWPSSRMCEIHANRSPDFDHWGGGARSHACGHDPVVMALRSDGSNLCTIGMAWTAPETKLDWKPLPGPNAEWNRTFRVSLTRPILDGMPLITREYRDGVFLSQKHESWYASLRRYSSFVDRGRGYAPRKPSPWSLSPCLSVAWTLWPPPQLKKDQPGWMRKIIETQSPLAKELGFDIIHVDVDAENDLYYRPNPHALSGFKGLMDKLNALDMILEMHVSTPVLPKGSADAEKYKEYVMATTKQPNGSSGGWGYSLCPRTVGMSRHLTEYVQRMMDLGVKSFWVDFCDDVSPLEPCIAKHEHAWSTHGEGWDAQMKVLTDAAWKRNPEITFIARRSIANINNKPYLTHGCAMDCEYDLAYQRRDAIFLRSFGPGLIPYTFHGLWPDSEPDTGVAMHMASYSLLMVPVVCQDLTRLSPGHLSVVKAWLRFYREHAADIIYGDLEPLVFEPISAAFRIERNHKAFVNCFEVVPGTVPLAGKPSEIYLFNGVVKDFSTRITGVEGRFRGQWLDHRLRPYGAPFEITAERGKMIVSAECPTLPCMLRLKQP